MEMRDLRIKNFLLNQILIMLQQKGKQLPTFLRLKKCFPTIVIRPYQVYGPNQDCNRLIPIVVTNCLQISFPFLAASNLEILYIDDFVKIVFKLMTDKEKTMKYLMLVMERLQI